ncbi:MAG: O-antigen ligase family protein, partial [Chloroflexi bacterium]|nr:O-antigen ligase family protein [Chloroflexota bacterium]
AIGPQPLGEALLDSGDSAAPSRLNLDLAGRKEVWSRALYAIQDFPFTGVGLNQFDAVADLLYPSLIYGPESHVVHTHNLYLQAAVDFGLGGLVAYVALLTSAGIVAIRAYRALGDSFNRALLLGLVAGLLAHQIFGLADAITLGAKPSFEWWVYLGLIAALGRRDPRQPRVRTLEGLGLWLAVSLLAISVVGDDAIWGVGLAVIGGCALGFAMTLWFNPAPAHLPPIDGDGAGAV